MIGGISKSGAALVSSAVSGATSLLKSKAFIISSLAIAALANMPTASAGPWFGSLVLIGCLPLIEAPPLFTACLVAAGASYAMPTP